MPSWIVPSDSHVVSDTGHTTDHNHVADDLTLVNSVLPVVSGGLTGAVQAARFVGATTSGAPASGTFAVGDFAVDRTGTIWLCVTAGSPGTWVALLNTSAAQTVSGIVTFTGSGSGTTGAIVADAITVFPNSGIGTGSASMFLNNNAGQVWEFFCSGGGLFGVYDKTAGAPAMSIAASTGLATFNGAVDIATAGKGLQVAEGANAKQGTVTLNGTTAVTVSNTSVTANSRIFLTIQSRGSVNPPGSPYVVTRTAGTSFQVASTVASDNSVVAYFITEPG